MGVPEGSKGSDLTRRCSQAPNSLFLNKSGHGKGRGRDRSDLHRGPDPHAVGHLQQTDVTGVRGGLVV